MTSRTGQTVAGAYEKIASHERECALRYKALEDGIGAVRSENADIKDGIRWAIKGVWAIALTLILGLTGVVWNYVQRDIAEAKDDHAVEQHVG